MRRAGGSCPATFLLTIALLGWSHLSAGGCHGPLMGSSPARGGTHSPPGPCSIAFLFPSETNLFCLGMALGGAPRAQRNPPLSSPKATGTGLAFSAASSSAGERGRRRKMLCLLVFQPIKAGKKEGCYCIILPQPRKSGEMPARRDFPRGDQLRFACCCLFSPAPPKAVAFLGEGGAKN